MAATDDIGSRVELKLAQSHDGHRRESGFFRSNLNFWYWANNFGFMDLVQIDSIVFSFNSALQTVEVVVVVVVGGVEVPSLISSSTTTSSPPSFAETILEPPYEISRS